MSHFFPHQNHVFPSCCPNESPTSQLSRADECVAGHGLRPCRGATHASTRVGRLRVDFERKREKLAGGLEHEFSFPFHIWDNPTYQIPNISSDWWFGTWLLFFHILGIIPTDFPIFQRDRYTTNQKTVF